MFNRAATPYPHQTIAGALLASRPVWAQAVAVLVGTAVLAALIGVNIGPNLSYVGSLANLLWLRIVREEELAVDLRGYVRAVLPIAVPPLRMMSMAVCVASGCAVAAAPDFSWSAAGMITLSIVLPSVRSHKNLWVPSIACRPPSPRRNSSRSFTT